MFKYIGIWILAAASNNILVTPYLEVAVTADRNIVYCATTQDVRFLLDESGVSVESSMEWVADEELMVPSG